MGYDNYNRLREAGKTVKFCFANELQMDLWNNALVGQISDGMWENTVNSGYEFWCNVQTAVETSTVIEGSKRYLPIKYNFGFTRLIKYTGEDMIEIGRKYNTDYSENMLRKDLREISRAMKQFGE